MYCWKNRKEVFLRAHFFHGAALFALVFFSHAQLWAADAPPQYQSTATGSSQFFSRFNVDGYASVRYIYRTTSLSDERVSDQDLFTDLRFDITMPEKSRYEFHFFGTGRADLDGISGQREFYPFEDIGDARSSRLAGYLYEAHIDINRLLVYVPQVRVGRQTSGREEQAFFDGIAADINIVRSLLNMTIYAGAAVHFHELDRHWGDDTIAGLGVDYRPLPTTAVNLDYLSAKDEREMFSYTDRNDALYSLKLSHRFSSSLKATAKYRGINGESRDGSLQVTASVPDADLEASANYFRQFRTQNELSNEFSSYYDVLGQSHPYETYDIKVRKFFGKHYAIDLGYYNRSLLDEKDQGAFNREYGRVFINFEVADKFAEGLIFTIISEHWESGTNKFSSGGLDIGYVLPRIKNAKVGAGTYYSFYKYDYYSTLGERERVRTYYINGKYPFGQRYSANASYEYESGVERYQTVKFGMRYDF